MTSAETITVFLMDGDANGRIKASIENWTGLGYKIPRDMLDECTSIPYLNQSSVYFLFGSSNSSKNPVYIGQAVSRKNGKGILARLKEHSLNPEKDYWTDAIVFTTKDNSFGPTELSYLENIFCNMAIKAARYEVKNSNDPNSGNITEEKESALNRFAAYTKLILGVFGYKVFTPLSDYEKELYSEKFNTVKKDTSSKTSAKVNNIGYLDAERLIAGGRPSSVYLKKHLIETGYISDSCNFTIAKINKDGSGRFWANPPIEYLDGEWVLVLNDIVNRQLHFFRIPAKSINKTAVKTRTIINKSGKSSVMIDFEVVHKGDKYVCVASGIEYQSWYIESVNY